MKMVVQRVKSAKVTVGHQVVAQIDQGILTLVGFTKDDREEDLKRLMERLVNLRIFADQAGKMNLSLLDIKGAHLLVSQFTLAADTEQGRRPSFTGAENPERAKVLFSRAVELSHSLGVPTQQGVFGADMQVELTNDGPVTFVLTSP